MTWRAQVLAYFHGQDVFRFLDGSSQPPAQIVPNTSTELVLFPPWPIRSILHGAKGIK
jgi:hypothetical protein